MTIESEGPSASDLFSAMRGRRPRPDGWTKERRERFLAELSMDCNVKAACASVGLSQSSAYSTRRRDATFRAAWRAALAEGYARLEQQMLERALLGETVLRSVLEEVEGRETLDLLNRYKPPVVDTLYRVHRGSVLREDQAQDDDPDGSKARASVEAKLDKLRAWLKRQAQDAAEAD